MATNIENFYGCYLLVSANVKYKGWTYIGFTVDPNRRCNQHNIGREKGGAWRTSGKGPWDMVLIIHGFPSKVAALQFEWAWQHPEKSSKLKDVHLKHKKLKGFKYRFAIVSEMLRVGPWNRLPLTIRWLNQDFVTNFHVNIQPPTHMSIAYGPVKCTHISNPNCPNEDSNKDGKDAAAICTLCSKPIKETVSLLHCLSESCPMSSHMRCLAENFLSQEGAPNMVLPIAGDCVLCRKNLLWGDLIRQQQGCYQHPFHQTQVEMLDKNRENSPDHWSAALSQS